MIEDSTPFIQVVETQGDSETPLIEHFDLSLASLEDWACFHGRTLMANEEKGGAVERKAGDDEDFDPKAMLSHEDECIRLGTPDILRGCAYILGADPGSFDSLAALARYATLLDEATLAPSLVEEGKFTLSPSGTIPDPGASQAFVTYFCDGSASSQPYVCPYQTLTTVYLL